MPPEKSQLDTLSFYLGKVASPTKVDKLLSKFRRSDGAKAHKAILLFETRNTIQLKDIEKILG